MATAENLLEAFAGESQANRKYLAFAQKADREGYPQVAKLFRAVASVETIHAHAHLRVLGGVRDTLENVQEAADGEAHEFKSMYPGFLAEAEAEGNKAAQTSIKSAMAVEEVHHGLYLKAFEAVKAGKDLENATVYVCPVCGNTHIGTPPEKCAVCGVPGATFEAVA